MAYLILLHFYHCIFLKGRVQSVCKQSLCFNIMVFKILNFIRQLFILSCFYSIINDQDIYNNQALQEHKMN
jgi:hypothetical protein